MTEQQLMFNDKELELIKSVFAENEPLLLAIRKLFFGADLSDDEKDMIKSSFSNPEVKTVFRKKVYGLNNLETPVGQLSDFWLGAEKQIFGASKDTIKQALESKKRILSMFEKCFQLLDNPDGEKVSIEYNYEEDDELGIGMITRNLFMMAIENALLTIKVISGEKKETLEQTIERLKKDSSR